MELMLIKTINLSYWKIFHIQPKNAFFKQSFVFINTNTTIWLLSAAEPCLMRATAVALAFKSEKLEDFCRFVAEDESEC